MEKRKTRNIAIGVLIAILFGPGFITLLVLSYKNRKAERRLEELQAQYERLIEERDRLKNDPVYVEGLMRSTFKVSKPGEIVVPLDSEEPTKASR